MGKTACLCLVLVPADAHLEITRPIGAPVLLEGLDDIRVARGVDEAITDPTGKARRLGTRSRDDDRRSLVRKRVQPRVVDGEVLPLAVDGLARPQSTDDLARLLQHRGPRFVAGPARADDMLVQLLPGPEPEEEATGHQR